MPKVNVAALDRESKKKEGFESRVEKRVRSKEKQISTLPMRDDHGPSKNQPPKKVRRMRAKLEARQKAFESNKNNNGFTKPGSQKMH